MKSEKSANEEIKENLKKYLQRGDITKVALKHKRSIYTVNKVINGTLENIEILQSLVEIAEFVKGVKERASQL